MLHINKSYGFYFIFMEEESKKMTMQEAGRLGAIASKNITNWLKRQERIVAYYKNPKLCALCKNQ